MIRKLGCTELEAARSAADIECSLKCTPVVTKTTITYKDGFKRYLFNPHCVNT